MQEQLDEGSAVSWMNARAPRLDFAVPGRAHRLDFAEQERADRPDFGVEPHRLDSAVEGEVAVSCGPPPSWVKEVDDRMSIAAVGFVARPLGLRREFQFGRADQPVENPILEFARPATLAGEAQNLRAGRQIFQGRGLRRPFWRGCLVALA
jgi:hypothetical protein